MRSTPCLRWIGVQSVRERIIGSRSTMRRAPCLRWIGVQSVRKRIIDGRSTTRISGGRLNDRVSTMSRPEVRGILTYIA